MSDEKNKKEEVKKTAKEKASKSLIVCKGKSITSKKGILNEGDEVKAEFFHGGQKDLDTLKKLECVE